MSTHRTLIFAALILTVAACDDTDPQTGPFGGGDPHALIDEAPDGSFHLFVSNQSFDLDQVDITVWLDDEPWVTGDFDVESQHNWYGFDFELDSGSHTVRAESEDGDALLEEDFDFDDEHWAVIDFWFDDNNPEGTFTFFISDEEIGFM